MLKSLDLFHLIIELQLNQNVQDVENYIKIKYNKEKQLKIEKNEKL